MSSTRISILSVLLCFASVLVAAAPAHAAPAGRAGVRTRPSGDSQIRYQPPERVVGGNAVSLLMPFQIGIVGYLPKARFGFAYDRQIVKSHWVYGSLGLLADYGNFQNFRMDRCGFEDSSGARPTGLCGNGSVLGFDIGIGYVYRWYLAKRPAIVPFVRGGLGFSWWKYPDLVGDLQQDRDSTFAMTFRPAGGVRFFVTGDFGLGFEVELPFGFSVHDRTLEGEDGRSAFLLGVAALLGFEYRF